MLWLKKVFCSYKTDSYNKSKANDELGSLNWLW